MRGLSTAAKKNLRVDPGGLKNPKHKKCEKTTLEKNPLKKRKNIRSSMSNKLTNSPSPVRSTDLFDAEPSIPIAVQSQEPQSEVAWFGKKIYRKPMETHGVLRCFTNTTWKGVLQLEFPTGQVICGKKSGHTLASSSTKPP
jgi:hypothetical protein